MTIRIKICKFCKHWDKVNRDCPKGDYCEPTDKGWSEWEEKSPKPVSGVKYPAKMEWRESTEIVVDDEPVRECETIYYFDSYVDYAVWVARARMLQAMQPLDAEY